MAYVDSTFAVKIIEKSYRMIPLLRLLVSLYADIFMYIFYSAWLCFLPHPLVSILAEPTRNVCVRHASASPIHVYINSMAVVWYCISNFDLQPNGPGFSYDFPSHSSVIFLREAVQIQGATLDGVVQAFFGTTRACITVHFQSVVDPGVPLRTSCR